MEKKKAEKMPDLAELVNENGFFKYGNNKVHAVPLGGPVIFYLNSSNFMMAPMHYSAGYALKKVWEQYAKAGNPVGLPAGTNGFIGGSPHHVDDKMYAVAFQFYRADLDAMVAEPECRDHPIEAILEH